MLLRMLDGVRGGSIRRIKAILQVTKDWFMQEQRYLPALRAHIDYLISKGWVIAMRDPLKLQFRDETCVVMHGMLIGED
ncbi:hypothetical protein SAMN05216600_1133 [Pseudomonas cuatrocienegasensis]|uniref:Uncharacterized protein n=1 Tax=Pseudomonas cuatrocienegasensis TaxID=543360 RepID=A0ABY1BJ40_9PSED|nr:MULTISPECIES: hypothetical protein [Pseudomonas]OEC35028.1 hypothetical protein A7D25_10595 [Pseudomonas sp. 21C1]SEQ99075.1 hypothetical protein SAMN05216600_1133 [Pseudomonas cuatrocienegasensis]